ncbi:hypothetical protein [Mesorhizobium sp. M1A.F.Ca.IN.022.06.1.1]|uniref:hypothetical protein n=1 Tax=Mesorhizobium sp. M1A.F.Ca.IN.022.06.1.1 TaxID=2493680 RepID=UPI001ABFA12C|nr:hypothetical protein [Mesorhizobium sp. M1A.F.Ca.IN.022.06.1.1]
MPEKGGREELVRVYRDPAKGEDVIIEVLGQPVGALKQMKAEPWLLRDKSSGDNTDKSK